MHVPDLIRFVDEQVPDDARIALAITASYPGYVLLGPRLRRFDLLSPQASDAPGASWMFVSPLSRASGTPPPCGAWERSRQAPERLGRVPAGASSLLTLTSGRERVAGIEPA